MIAVDTNVLVYAHREELPQHRSAYAKLVELAEGDALWGIPVFCVGEFVRVITHPRLFDPPYGADEACRALDRLLASPTVRVLHPGPAFVARLSEAVREADAVGNLVFDAQIVAVCRESGVTRLLTEDRDFTRFRRFPVQGL
jgi:toxin-antitoxin system PIN domain toxin